MKRFLKIVGFGILGVLLCVLLLIGSVEFLRWRDERRLDAIVAQLAPGTPISTAVALLGEPVRMVTDIEEMRVLAPHSAPMANPEMTTLQMFTYKGTAYYWVLVYSDRGSSTVRRAEWQTM